LTIIAEFVYQILIKVEKVDNMVSVFPYNIESM